MYRIVKQIELKSPSSRINIELSRLGSIDQRFLQTTYDRYTLHDFAEHVSRRVMFRH